MTPVAGFEIHFDMLEECATKAKGVANQFKTAADEAPPSVSTSCFGDLEGSSGRLVSAVNDLEAKIDAEVRHAQQNLTKVEAAIQQVVDNVRRADHPDVPRTEQV
ncbi:hypothetical protein ABZ897_01665 [Nonomuraea sp. NPDC046802]|uniref:hypothetical protein n=1 Tax=Nonomuraea sp. NPDC046802 TaxID=3154919 RepID=UPI0033E8BA47